MDHEKFFSCYGDDFVRIVSLGVKAVKVEDLYQAIKARLVAELEVEVLALEKQHTGRYELSEQRWPLIDTTKEDK